MHGRRKMDQDECVKLGQKFRRYQGDDESEMKRININAIVPYLI